MTATLAAAAEAMADQHRSAVRALRVDQHFALLHGAEPPEASFNQLIEVGGDGTPMVQELPIFERGIARGVHAVTARNDLAAALDLDHRLPIVWTALQESRGQVWVAKKVAAASRHLDRHQVKVVYAAVAKAWDEAPGRVLRVAEASIMRADPEHARNAAEERARRRYLALGRLQGEDAGMRKIFGLIDAGDAE